MLKKQQNVKRKSKHGSFVFPRLFVIATTLLIFIVLLTLCTVRALGEDVAEKTAVDLHVNLTPPTTTTLTNILDSMSTEQEISEPYTMHIETNVLYIERPWSSTIKEEVFIVDQRCNGDEFDVEWKWYNIAEDKSIYPTYEKRFIYQNNQLLCKQLDVGFKVGELAVWLQSPRNAGGMLTEPYGSNGLLFGQLLGDTRSIVDILKNGKSVILRNQAEEVDGITCYVIEGKTDNGYYKIWVDPLHGFRIRKALVHKKSGDLCYGEPLPHSSRRGKTIGFRLDISDVQLKKVGDYHLPISETMVRTYTYEDGTKYKVRFITKRSDIQLNPNFGELGAFMMDGIPEGTQVVNLDPENFGYGYKWENGKLATIDREGTTVIGHISVSEGVNIPINWLDRVYAFIQKKAKDENSQALKQQPAEEERYEFHISKDGTFRIENIPMGTYELDVSIMELTPDNSGFYRPIANVVHELIINEEFSGDINKPFDMGKLKLSLCPVVNIGDYAPLFEIQSIDGKILKLRDYRGKYVLLHFWATWCRSCIAEFQELKDVYSSFGKNKHFIMIGLSEDEKEDPLKKYIKVNNIKWLQSCLGKNPKTSILSDYGIYGIPAVFLIGPDGRILAKELPAEKIKSTITEILGKKSD